MPSILHTLPLICNSPVTHQTGSLWQCITVTMGGQGRVGLGRHSMTTGSSPAAAISAPAGRQRHSLMQASSPADARSPGSAGCHLTQFTSRGWACPRVHSRQKESPVPLPPCCMKRSRSAGSAAAASAAAAAASSSTAAPDAGAPPASPAAASAAAAAPPSPNIRMALSAAPLAMRPAFDQSTEKMVRS